jgi:hypothetical protein
MHPDPDDLTWRIDAHPLLRARRDAVRTGAVPVQTLKRKVSNEDRLAALRRAMFRATEAAQQIED